MNGTTMTNEEVEHLADWIEMLENEVHLVCVEQADIPSERANPASEVRRFLAVMRIANALVNINRDTARALDIADRRVPA